MSASGREGPSGGSRGSGLAALRQMLRTALLGRCPACDRGRIFEGWLDVCATCTRCGANLRPTPSSHYGGPIVIAYGVATLAAFGVGGLLWWRYGIFPHIEWIIAATGGLAALLAYRPARAWWTWLLWVARK